MNLSVSLLLAREASTAVYIPRFPSLYNAGLRYLLECYVKNKIRLSVLVRSGVPGDERRYGGPDWDVNWWQANEGHRFHNALEFQDFSSVPKKNAENVMGESVKTVIKQFSQRNEPFTWVVGPNPQPQLEDILVRHSLQRTQSQIVMYRRCAQETEDKERMPWGASVALDILVRHIVREGVRSWVAAWAMGGPPSDIDHWTKIYENALVDCPRYFHMFAAQNGDEVVGTGFPHCWGGRRVPSRPLCEAGLAEPGHRQALGLVRFESRRDVRANDCHAQGHAFVGSSLLGARLHAFRDRRRARVEAPRLDGHRWTQGFR